MGYQLLGLSTDRAVPTGRVRLETPRFYLNIAVYMAALVIIGFWPSYFAPLLHGNAARPWVIHFHSIVFVGWMALLLVQILLVYRGRIQLHRTLGNIGIAYGALVFILGVVVAFAAPILHLKNGEWQMDRAAGFVLIALRAIAVFGIFFAGSVVYKRKPEIHKRLILLATVALLFAPVGRMIPPQAGALFLVVWLSPILIAMGRDVVAGDGVHSTFIIGLAVLLAGFTPVLFSESDGYLKMGRSLLRIFM